MFKKEVRRVFIACLLIAWFPNSTCQAVGFELGPTVGLGGYRMRLTSKEAVLQSFLNTHGWQVGLFSKIDLGGLYAKPSLLFTFGKTKLSLKQTNPSRTNHHTTGNAFQSIVVPVEVGLSILGILRPHIGVLLDVPLALAQASTRQDGSIKKSLQGLYRKSQGHIFFGAGVDLAGLLIDLDFVCSFSNTPSKNITSSNGSPLPIQINEHRKKQFSLRLGYNLLRLIKAKKQAT